MMKILVADPTKCTGCRVCEIICSVKKEGVSNPARARIGVIKSEITYFDIPIFCQQCESPICVPICPTNAISREEELGRIMIDYDLCIGCKICVTICPFGGIGFDPIAKKVIKCDLCDGDPVCAKFCETKALEFMDTTIANMRKKREAAEKFSELVQKLFTR
jgi:Fe-S-cluster-containing hydrogenase component 2